MPVKGPKGVVVHPIVLLSAVDHFNRMSKIGNQKRVVGVLLGSRRKGGVIDVATSFAVPFDEDDKDVSVWFLDHNYLENMAAMYKKVNAREQVVGWYHTGPKLHPNDIAVHDRLSQYCPSPVLVVIDVSLKEQGLPTDAYYAVEEVHDDGTPTSKSFEHVPSEIGAEEAEEVGVEHLLRDIQDKTVGTLAQRISNQLLSLEGLRTHLEGVRDYLHLVAIGKLPKNHTILYQLQDIFNLLPNLNLQEFSKAFAIRSNDQLLIVYLASLIRAIVALHHLIQNKITNHEAEKQEGHKKEKDGKKEEKKDDKKDEKKEDKKDEKKDTSDKDKKDTGKSKDKSKSTDK